MIQYVATNVFKVISNVGCIVTDLRHCDYNGCIFISDLFEEGDERIDSKWGPAGCIKLNEDTWIFFGYAST